MSNRALLEHERNRLADFGYYADLDIGSTDPDRYDKVKSLAAYNHERAIARYQEFFKGALDEAAQTFYQRDIKADGDWGDVSGYELGKARCSVADIWTQQEIAAREEGNWPDSCRMELTISHVPGMTLRGLDGQRGIEEMIDESLKNWMDVIEMRIIRVSSSQWPQTNIYIEDARLGGSVLADQFLAISQCSYRSKGRMDNDRTWSSALAVSTRSHEDGHAFGLGHSRSTADTMSPSINSQTLGRRGMPSSGDVAAMLRIGYEKRTSTPDPPDPEAPGGTAKITVEHANGETTRYLAIPF